MNLLGLARFTKDLDLFIAPEADNVARLKAALRSVFEDPHIEEITADDLLGDYPAVQYVPPEGTFHLDILTRLGEALRYADLETQRVPFGDLSVTVVTPRTLYRMKKGTVRLQDRADAEALRRHFGLKEE
jgi:Nucleotidyl transferase AbiEii toxin, Type IV TA system